MSNPNQAALNQGYAQFLVGLAQQTADPVDFVDQVGRILAAAAFIVIEGSEGGQEASPEEIAAAVIQSAAKVAYEAFPGADKIVAEFTQ